MKGFVRVFSVLLSVALLWAAVSCSASINITPNEFEYQEPSMPNPIKGFASLYGQCTEDSSLEYMGVKFSDIYEYDEEKGSRLNKTYINSLLFSVAERGNSLIIRPYIIYPGHNNENDTGIYLPDSLYQYLKKSGQIKSNTYGGYKLEYPNFNSSVLIDHMIEFITLLGEEYDGHPALAAVQLGLYGSWGEWNMSGCTNGWCAMTDKNLSKLLDAYTASFKQTKLMARNPSLGNASKYDVGYHDDNFLFNTSDFHKQSAEWKALLKKIDVNYGTLQQFYDFINGCNGNYEPIWDKWQTQMFGGELSGMMYTDYFGPILKGTEREALDYCIKQFHVTWLSGVGKGGIPYKDSQDYQEYLEIAGSFGYKIGIQSVSVDSDTDEITVSLTNYGVAPFYYDWDIEYSVLDETGKSVCTVVDEQFKLSELLPEGVMQSTFAVPKDLERGKYTVSFRVVNPVEKLSAEAKLMKLANNHALSDGIYEIASLNIK